MYEIKYTQRELEEKILSKKQEIKILEEKIAQLSAEDKSKIQLPESDEIVFEREFLSQLMDNIPDSIYFKDKKSRFIKVSKSFARKHSFESQEEALGKTDFDIFTEEHAQKAFDDEQHIINTGETLVNIEEKETRENGKQSWASTTKLPLKNAEGEIIGTFGISRDITEKKKTEAVLQKKEKKLSILNATKDKFFSIIAHDLKNPFNSIVGYSHLASDYIKKGDYEEAAEFCEIVTESSEKAMELLENLLEWAYSQKGQIKFNAKIFKIKPLINNTIKLFKASVHEKNLEIINNVNPELKVRADEAMLKTIFRNLLSNAVKFSNPYGKIEISSEENAKLSTFTIKDEGIGIDNKKAQNLFHIQNSVKESESCSGLGLILCKEFIDRHNGTISISGKEGEGAVVKFSLPK
jgi:PAS domain S-box-containing protein